MGFQGYYYKPNSPVKLSMAKTGTFTHLGLCNDVSGQLDHGEVALANSLLQLVLSDAVELLGAGHGIAIQIESRLLTHGSSAAD